MRGLGMEPKGTWLTPPPLHNSSCPQRFLASPGAVSFWNLCQALLILVLSAGILGANLVLILVVNSRRYQKYIHAQPRYLLTSLASNDLAIGLFVTPFGFLPAVYRCWPYGEIFCQIQSLLRGALAQQSAVILVCMAVDRYMCMLHPVRYHKHSSKKRLSLQGCVAIISLTWVTSVALFAVMVLPRGGYYFNSTGLLACDPFFSKPSLRILASCLFYFPTTMILMYCYGSAFHVDKLRLRRVAGAPGGVLLPEAPAPAPPPQPPPPQPASTQTQQMALRSGEKCAVCSGLCSSSTVPDDVVSATGRDKDYHVLSIEEMVAAERRLSTNTSRTMAAISLGFIVMVTPWTIQEVVAACTGSKVPAFLDFLATWLALSNSFWNPFFYWLLNSQFRRVCREMLLSKFLCRRRRDSEKSSNCCCGGRGSGSGGGSGGGSSCGGGASPGGSLPPPPPTAIVSPGDRASSPGFARPDLEGLSEKYWGEILERTVSSNSLQTLQRVYGTPPAPPPPPPPPPPLTHKQGHRANGSVGGCGGASALYEAHLDL